MKMLRQKLMDYQEGRVIDIEDLLKSALERRIGDYSYQKAGEIQVNDSGGVIFKVSFMLKIDTITSICSAY